MLEETQKPEYFVQPITFGLDFDDTFTADPQLWCYFIRMSQERGHRVLIVTARDYNFDSIREIKNTLQDIQGVDIVHTGGEPKIYHCSKLGVKIDIWIDDNPERLVYGC